MSVGAFFDSLYDRDLDRNGVSVQSRRMHPATGAQATSGRRVVLVAADCGTGIRWVDDASAIPDPARDAEVAA